MNQFYKKALDAVAKEAIGAAGRYAGNYLLNSLTQEGQDDFVGPRQEQETDMQPGQSEKAFREGAKDLTPRFSRDALPKGYGAQTLLGGIVENPVDTAVFAKNIAPYAGMAVAGTALHAMFGGKPSSEYKVPVQPKSYQSVTSATAGGGGFGPYNNANIAASNASTANTAYLETLKHKHNLEVIKAKAQAREPGVQDIGGTSMPTPTPRSAAEAYASAVQKPSAMNEELMSFARMLYGTGLKL